MFIIGIAILVDRRTEPITTFIALQSPWMVAFWTYQLVYLLRDGHSASARMLAGVLAANYVINCWFYGYVRTRLMNSTDAQFKVYLDTHRGT